MRIIHRSRSLAYRSPYGAAAAGTLVHFALDITDTPVWPDNISLCYAYGLQRFQESRIRLAPDHTVDEAATSRRWQTRIRLPDEPGLLFYWFEVKTGDERQYFVRNRDALDGDGRISRARPRFYPGEPHDPSPWQITIHASDFSVPDWITGQVVYQIFPDRFRRDRRFSTERFAAVHYPERIFHENWEDDVDYHGRPETGYLACDFFGGSIAGIEEKLDELASLGTGVIYLNPIFRARSNHRYDTGDYEQIDPLLGSEEDFSRLCREAADRGIRVMLDGVFSHTGADSRYFNKLGRYTDRGAFQEVTGGDLSPYSSWYNFHRHGDQLFYDSWWGFQDLPSVNEYDLSFQAYINGADGIIRRWLRLGASGWRLDVSDELPDLFLRSLRRASRQEKADAVLMGEVWEDASHKISYGHYRDFLFGRTHDLVMGYPFQQALTGWLSGRHPSFRLALVLEQIRENYPLPSFYSSYNLISSHDIARAITTLAGQEDPGERSAQARISLTGAQRSRGERLLRLAFLFQVMYPGSPVIYYGDEIGMEGYRDPFNRRTYPETVSDKHPLYRWFQRYGTLRRQWPVLRTGFCELNPLQDDLVMIRRWLDEGNDVFGQPQPGPAHVTVLISRNDQPVQTAIGPYLVELGAYGAAILSDGQLIEPEKTGVRCLQHPEK